MNLAFALTTPGFRVTRTFAFVDLCGFTDFVDEHGDERGVAELRLLRAVVREVAPLCGVRVDKWLGDGVMLVGVDPEPVVACVLTIRQRLAEVGRLPLRAGIAAGNVLLLEGDDYAGRTVNLAARLCDRADPGKVLGAADGLAVPEGVRVDPLPPMHVRGLRAPVDVIALDVRVGQTPMSSPTPPKKLRFTSSG